jgi:TIR domain
MGYVFLSYSSSDARLVQRLIESLNRAGHTVWVDRRRILGGAEWAGEIVDAIEGAAAVLVALSPGSMESDHVRKELALAVEAKKLIVPVWIERTAVSKKLRYYLADIQQIDLASDFDVGLAALLDALTPIVQGKLDSILSDPQLTTRKKIDAWIKARTQHKEPDEIRMDRLAEQIQELTNDRAAVDAEIEALEESRSRNDHR